MKKKLCQWTFKITVNITYNKVYTKFSSLYIKNSKLYETID